MILIPARISPVSFSTWQVGYESHQSLTPAATSTPNTSPGTSRQEGSSAYPGAIPAATSLGSPGAASLKAPPPPPIQGISKSAGAAASTLGKAPIAPMPGAKVPNDSDSITDVGSDDKRQQKRAANRKSAQLSRKRKKQYIEELKEENDELRRKEQILRSIPDLIVVFDSSGKLAFVSQSVSHFLGIAAEDLEGTSFWDRLCEESVRLLKAAFMDSLAARNSDSETAPLGTGVWELRLKDKDSKDVVITLNGVVHFTGDAPECVCCIRPRHQKEINELPRERKSKPLKSQSRLVSSSDGSRSSYDRGSSDLHTRARVNPSQSVISNDNSNQENSADDDLSPKIKNGSSRQKVRRSLMDGGVRNHDVLSDCDSGCEVSESSGSDDGIASC